MQNKVSGEFDSLTNDSSCGEIATAVTNSNLTDDYTLVYTGTIANNTNAQTLNVPDLSYKEYVIMTFCTESSTWRTIEGAEEIYTNQFCCIAKVPAPGNYTLAQGGGYGRLYTVWAR